MNDPKTTIGLRWFARAWSLASIAFIGLFLVGNWPPPLVAQAVAFPLGVLVGLVIAWRNETLGGAITVAAMALFYLMEYASAGVPPSGPWFLLIAAPGLLFLLAALSRRLPVRRATAG